jgi:formylglycine-generating enzyme required for sulfatase activity
MPTPPRIFISYARVDGSDHSLRLYNDLKAHDIGVWRDQSINPAVDFTGEIETAFSEATHVVVIVTPDLKRTDSFVRLEIGYALTQKKPIIPLVFPGGHRPIVIINHTYINFADWDSGFKQLLERLKNLDVQEIDPQTRREHELAYLQAVGQKYDHWRDLYTDMSATARIEEPKVKLKPAAKRMIDTRHAIHQKIDHSLDAEKGKTVKTESLDELRDGLRDYRRVALIGDPGAGKTTTLERLAYEYASAAAEETDEPYTRPLPLFVRLGAYGGGDFTQFLEESFGSLHLRDYLPKRVVLLLDGLNEMPPNYHAQIDEWLRKNPDVAVIVSCRKLDYIERKLPLQRVDVQPLDLERIRLFMGNYLEDTEREILFWALAGHDARRVWAWYKEQVNDVTYRHFFIDENKPMSYYLPYPEERKLIDKLRYGFSEQQHLPDMLGVVTNPFLLQIVIEIYALSGEPPSNKGDLFGRFVTLLMEERGKIAERPERPWIDETLQKQALAALAYRMQRERTGTSVTVEFVLETFRQAAKTASPDHVLYFAVSASILEQTDSVRFSHQLLQEYFAAYEMGEDLRRGVPASKYFPSDEWWMPTGWEETAVLLAGMERDCTKVVEWLTPVQPDLAYKIATESGADCAKDALQALYEPAEGARRSPYAVAEWGRLNHEDDQRPGVGLRPDRLPDIAWCDVPAGTFLYGDNKQPVKMPYRFKIAKYPVTMRQFQAFIDSGEYEHLEWWGGFPKDYQPQPMRSQNNPYHNHPRDSVSWYQAVAFTRWLDAKYRAVGSIPSGLELRLPTEHEWEYAARGTDGREYPWGDNYKVGYANLDEQNQGFGSYFLNRTTAVGNYPQGKSPFQVMDMSGLIWEWCLDEYAYSEADGAWNLAKGGSFEVPYDYSSASALFANQPYIVKKYFGFRVVLSAPIASLASKTLTSESE